MHQSVYDYVQSMVTYYGVATEKTLEVGSYNENGSVRDLFRGPYTGVDMREGAGVDLVMEAAFLRFPDNSFGVVLSTEMLEHDPRPWQSVKEMARVLEPGGYLIMTARGYGYPKHDYPSDYWRFSVEGFEVLLADVGLIPLDIREDPQVSGVFAVAQKGA